VQFGISIAFHGNIGFSAIVPARLGVSIRIRMNIWLLYLFWHQHPSWHLLVPISAGLGYINIQFILYYKYLKSKMFSLCDQPTKCKMCGSPDILQLW